MTPMQKAALEIIEREFDENGYAPSYRELADLLGMASLSGVHRIILGLEERGYLARLPYRARAIMPASRSEGFNSEPALIYRHILAIADELVVFHEDRGQAEKCLDRIDVHVRTFFRKCVS